MEECVKMGLTKSIGVSNFNFQLLNDLLCYCEIKPVCNQIEMHPYFPQTHFVEWMKTQKILPVSYNTMGGSLTLISNTESPLFDPIVMKIAESKKADPANICVCFEISRMCGVVVKTKSFERSKSNMESSKMTLTEDEKTMMTTMKRCCRVTDPVKLGILQTISPRKLLMVAPGLQETLSCDARNIL